MCKENYNPKPKDDKTFWLKSHCGPGNIDPNKECGFCGDTQENCAKRQTEVIKTKHTADVSEYCGGSGFWCYKCGLFYANDACGETYDDEYETASGITVIVKDGYTFCTCGAKLFNTPQEEID